MKSYNKKIQTNILEKWDTILMIEHDPTILRFADHVIHLENGKLVENK